MYLELNFMKMLNCLPLFLVLCFALTISQVNAAVNIDSPASSNGAFNVAGVTSLTWSHTVGNNLSRALFVSVSTSSTTLGVFPNARVTGVTYGGTALTLVGTQLSNSNRNSVEIYRLVSPPSGPATIEVSVLPGVANYVLGGGTSYSGVDPANPNGAFTSGKGNNTAPSIIVPDGVAGDLVLDTLAFSPTGGFTAHGAGQTLRWNGRSFFTFAFDIGGGSTEPAMSPVTMSWVIGSMDQWVLAGIAIKSLSTTAAESTISGQIKTFSGRPIAYTSVNLQNLETGEVFNKTSNHFGYYSFENLETDNLYQISVRHGRYTFSPDSQIFQVTQSLTDIDFVGSAFGNNKNQVFRKRLFMQK